MTSTEIKIVASEEEHKQITTNPDELLKQSISKETATEAKKNVAQKAKPQQRFLKVNVNPEQRFFKHKDVSLDELKYLVAKGYREIKCLNIEGKKEMYLIKPRPNEGQEHFFLTYNITEYLKSKNIPFQLFNSVKPDIVFTNNGKKITI